MPVASPPPPAVRRPTPIESDASSGIPVFLARRPILDRRRSVVAYELLDSGGLVAGEGRAAHGQADGDSPGGLHRTVEVIRSAVCDFGLDAAGDDRLVVVRLPATALAAELATLLPGGRILIDIRGPIGDDPQALRMFRQMQEQGTRFACGWPTLRAASPGFRKLVGYVRLDMAGRDAASVLADVPTIRQAVPRSTILLGGVDQPSQFETAADAGVELFSGPFFCRPEIVEGRRLTPDRSRTLNLLAQLQDNELTLPEAAKLITGDPTLSVKLLAYINSAAVGLNCRVESIRKAAILVGFHRLRVWVALLGLSGMSSKPPELMMLANVRARMCEQIGERLFAEPGASYFTVGMFSLLDAFTETPLAETIGPLPLTDEVKAALLDGDGPMGQTLAAVRDWQAGRFTDVSFDVDLMRTLYSEAIDWAQAAIGGSE